MRSTRPESPQDSAAGELETSASDAPSSPSPSELSASKSSANPASAANTTRRGEASSVLQLLLASGEVPVAEAIAREALAFGMESGTSPITTSVLAADPAMLDEGAPEGGGSKPTAPSGSSGAVASSVHRTGADAPRETPGTATGTNESAASGSRSEIGDARARTERAERILEQVRLRIRPELSEATVELRPRELGRIAIQIAVRDGRVRASVRAERAEALAVLEAHVPELRAMFEAAGLEPHALDLGMGFAQSGSRDPDHTRDGDEHGASRACAAVETATALCGHEPLALALADRMGIDTYA